MGEITVFSSRFLGVLSVVRKIRVFCNDKPSDQGVVLARKALIFPVSQTL
jgi:hypothetical protein